MKILKTLLIGVIFLLPMGLLFANGQNESEKAKAGVNKKLPVIALSNSYYGNAWRKQMVTAFEEAAEKAKADGLISDYIVVNGDGSQNQQISQMNSLILQGVDAICINSASPTALNGVIEKASEVGIKILAFDSIATSPDCYKLDFNFVNQGELGAEYVVKTLGGKGNVIIVRGVSGSAPDKDMYTGQMSVLKKNPGIKIVATIQGEASATVSQTAIANILPSLPKIDAVLTQGGGDAYGVVQAFESSKRDMPVVIGDNSAEFIKWWYGKQKTGYDTISVCSAPGIGGAALWLMVNILEGMNVPEKMSLSVIPVTKDNITDFLDLKPGTLASPNFTNEWVKDFIKNY